MKNEMASPAFLTYWFQIEYEKIDSFQVWAAERGMPFWEQHRGVIQYRTFRQRRELEFQTTLAGLPAEIDGLSQVEFEDAEALKRILLTPEFQVIQNELLQFIIPSSLKYSFLECVYDSSGLAARLSKGSEKNFT
jgi:hypothetical protein